MPENIAHSDQRSLDLIHRAWNTIPDDHQRAQFNDYFIGALAAELPTTQVAAAIAAARRCCVQVRES